MLGVRWGSAREPEGGKEGRLPPALSPESVPPRVGGHRDMGWRGAAFVSTLAPVCAPLTLTCVGHELSQLGV